MTSRLALLLAVLVPIAACTAQDAPAEANTTAPAAADAQTPKTPQESCGPFSPGCRS